MIIMHDEIGEQIDTLRARFGDISFHACTNYSDLESAIDRMRPQVVFATNFETCGFPRTLLVEKPCIEWLALGFSGVDTVVPWDESRLVVTNSAGLASEQIAQYVIGAIYGLFQRLPLFAAQQARKEWRFEWIKAAVDVRVGLVGFGHIGRAVARLCRANGFTSLACRMHDASSNEVERVYPADRLHEMLATVDVVVICAPLTSATTDLFDDAAFKTMKPGSYFINVGRGAIVVEQALFDALSSGHLAGAYLDVVREEPLSCLSPLWGAPNCIITPHICSEFEGWFATAIDLFADNLDCWLGGHDLRNVVLPARGY